MSRILLDTNVVLRLAKTEDAQHELVRTAVGIRALRGDDGVLAPQVLIEFWVVATRPPDVNGFGWSPAVAAAGEEE